MKKYRNVKRGKLMSGLASIKVRNKLILMLILPVLALLYFSVNEIWNKFRVSLEALYSEILVQSP